MITKDKIFKYGVPALFVVAVAIVLIILFVPKGDGELILSAKDVTVKVNSEFEISYRVSDSYSNVTYFFEDGSFVEEVGRFKFKAVKTGATTVTLIAKSTSNQTATCKCEVNILPVETSGDNKGDEIVTPPAEENQPEPEAKFFIVSQQSTEVSENTVTLKNSKGYFTIELASGMSGKVQLFATDGISAKEMPMLGANSFMVTSEVSGKIDIYLNSFLLGEILICV